MRGLATDGFILDEIVNGIVDSEHEVWEEDEGTNIIVAECATAGHSFVFAEAVQWLTETRDVESIPNRDDFSVERKCSCALTSDIKSGFVTKRDRSISLWAVGVEGFVVREHHVGSTRIRAAIQ